uniref:efflux RND transporter permease subunit n=1 Tax=Roseiarcus sp. TaxID=1969460 RepID=UPI003F967570
VSLLCICIVFVPMFNLGGVAGYLFRPMAEAVVFALVASYVLSRTLVNTMACYLLASQALHETGAARPPTRSPLALFQRGFDRRFDATRRFYRRLLETALAARGKFIVGFLVAVAASFALAPYLGQNFFPPVANTQIKLHVRAPTGTRIEGTAMICDGVEAAIRQIIPPEALGPMVDNIGLPVSGINSTYNNSGTVGPADADILITVDPAYQSETDGYVTKMRETLPRSFPGTTFAFLPADIVSQILNFGLPAPIDVQVVGANFAANRRYAGELLEKISHVPGVADARIQQAANNPTLGVDVDRMRAAQVGLNEGDIAKSLQETLSGSFKVAPTFWINPKNGVAYPIVAQTPQYWINSVSSLENIPASAQDASQIVGGLATLKREVSPAVVSHYAVQPVIDIYAANQQRNLGAVSADIQRILDETAKDVPPGSSVVMRGQTQTMTYAYQQLFVGIALAVVLIYMLIVVNFQSWLDPFVIVSALPTALAGIVWMLFITRTTLSVPALTGAIMCMGVATANSILVVSFARERLAEGADAVTAAVDAGFTRFRPVLMTAFAMIIGMTPMALSTELNAPLGRAVIGGLICSTVATLLFVPAVFRLVHARKPSRASEPAPALTIEATPT